MGFSRAELESFRDREIPEFVPPRPRLLFVGINPGLWTAATGTPFARPGNRFYPALVAAGIIPRLPRIPDEGMPEEDRAMFFDAGIGITSIVHRATARGDELTRQELLDGAVRLTADVERWQPLVVAVLGLTAYRQGFQRPDAKAGRQDERIAGASLWVLPNPSGLNAHETLASLAAAYAAPAREAGIVS
jgi:TDG/mug DNA glycosylase family protein